ncbi:hypothetical protein SEA_BUDSKI_55 [Gordonia phage Budski]|nr:hypothetical protein SEA_BUDSKI_55 [Gordonia phage Budski]
MTDIRPSSRCACGKWWSDYEMFVDHVCEISAQSKCGRCSHQVGLHWLTPGRFAPNARTRMHCSFAFCECREFVDAYGDPVGSPDYVEQILRDPGLFDPVEQDARRRRGLISRAVNLAADLRAEGRYTQASVVTRCAEEIRELAEVQSRWIDDIAPAVKSDHFAEYLLAVAEWLIAEARWKGEQAEAYWRDDILPAVRAQSASRVSRVAHMRRGMRLDTALATIQQVRDAVKGARSTVQASDPHGTFQFFLDRVDGITSEYGGSDV